jgi:hypothetical protein
MVSEDSQYFGRLASVHRLSDLSDLTDSFNREMRASIHHGDDPGELLEVLTLRGTQPMLLEERDDDVP